MHSNSLQQTAQDQAYPSVAAPARLRAIDQLRGLAMILMTLDHVRDFFAPTPFDPLDWQAGSAAWFFTRWITHICAPGFVLLAGISAGLRATQHSKNALSTYLFTRGLLLIALELSWVSFSWQFGFSTLILQVIWAIGVAMCALALLLHLPRSLQICIAALCLLGHNWLDQFHGMKLGWWFQAMHEGGYIQLTADLGLVFVYPLLPWIGLMLFGYLLTPIWQSPAAKRQQFCWGLSLALLLGFVVLRLSASYGDPQPWSGSHPGYTLMAEFMEFLKLQKYPPSLLYLLITLSINFALLGLFERLAQTGWHSTVLQLFGQHAQFYYLLHIASLHLAGNLFMLLSYGSVVNFFNNPKPPANYQASLLTCYLAWGLSLLAFYWLLRYWASLRAKRKPVSRASC